MFTGIVQAIGKIADSSKTGGDIRLGIDSADLELSNTRPGDSISVNGVCLTAVMVSSTGFVADVSLETMDKTSLGQLSRESPVNLEKALTLTTALGGHLVSGHVDGVASVVAIDSDGRSTRYRFEIDPALQHYIAAKGSITIDGCSLTVNRVEKNHFEVNIIPHTGKKTLFQFYRPGSRVNIEVDIIARYLERLVEGRTESLVEGNDRFLKTLGNSGYLDNE